MTQYTRKNEKMYQKVLFCGGEKQNQLCFTFPTERPIWLGAKISAEAMSKRLRLKNPLKRKIIDGITESEIALKRVFFLKQIIQIRQ